MSNKVIENFRDHPSLRCDDSKFIFKIDDKVYLIREGIDFAPEDEEALRQLLS